MNMMKLAWQKFPCVLGSVFPLIRLCSGLSLATKGIGPLAAPLLLLVTCYFSLVTFHLTTPSLVTATFSACSYYLAEIRLSEPSAPRWVRHSYLSKGLRLIPYTCGSSEIHENTFPPPQASVSARSHLGHVLLPCRRRDSDTEGFFINTMTSPMMRE